jgi:hypothetical protein
MKLDYTTDLKQVIATCSALRERAIRLQASITDRGFALALTVGIPRNMCCLHNASIDDNLQGWCKGNPAMLKIAKRANLIVNDWSATRLADAICKRLWNAFAARHGLCVGSPPEHVKVASPRLLFASIAA